MARYDASIIIEFAQRLYEQANLVLILFTIGGVVIGGGGGALLSPGVALIGALVLGVLGYLIGQTRAFQLKLQAQMALCQVAIEENTRKLVEGGAFKSEPLPSAQPSRATPIPVESKPVPLATPAKPASGSGRKCRECGAELPRAAEFCPKCLAQVA